MSETEIRVLSLSGSKSPDWQKNQQIENQFLSLTGFQMLLAVEPKFLFQDPVFLHSLCRHKAQRNRFAFRRRFVKSKTAVAFKTAIDFVSSLPVSITTFRRGRLSRKAAQFASCAHAGNRNVCTTLSHASACSMKVNHFYFSSFGHDVE